MLLLIILELWVLLYYICGGVCVLDLLWLFHLVGYRYCFVNCYWLGLCYFVFMLW